MSNSFSLEWKSFLPNPQKIYVTRENPLMPGFGIRDCNGQRDYSCGGQKKPAPKKIHTHAIDQGATTIAL